MKQGRMDAGCEVKKGKTHIDELFADAVPEEASDAVERMCYNVDVRTVRHITVFSACPGTALERLL